jgi:hypothetical protein
MSQFAAVHQALDIALTSTKRASEYVYNASSLASKHIQSDPDVIVMKLVELFTEVAALYVLLHKALSVSKRIPGVDLQALVAKKLSSIEPSQRGDSPP